MPKPTRYAVCPACIARVPRADIITKEPPVAHTCACCGAVEAPLKPGKKSDRTIVYQKTLDLAKAARSS